MAQLRVLHNYGGAPTGEQRIVPGVYDDGAPGLHGADAAYLVENGHAEWLEAPAVEAPSIEDNTPTSAHTRSRRRERS